MGPPCSTDVSWYDGGQSRSRGPGYLPLCARLEAPMVAAELDRRPGRADPQHRDRLAAVVSPGKGSILQAKSLARVRVGAASVAYTASPPVTEGDSRRSCSEQTHSSG